VSTHSYYPQPPPPAPKRRLRNTLLAITAIIAAGLMAAAGGALVGMGTRGDDGREDVQAAAQPSTSTPSSSPSGRDRIEAEQLYKPFAECRREVGPWLLKLQNINSRLSVGITQGAYNTALGSARIAYDGTDVAKVHHECLSGVGVPAERAFRHYMRANSIWDDCIYDMYCNLDRDAMPEIQEQWAKASVLLERASTNLEDLKQSLAGFRFR
jgi:hypothetical protein